MDTLIFHFLGLKILGFEATTTDGSIVHTLMFNTFVFAQIFNSVNSCRLDHKLNVFEGLFKYHYFIIITWIGKPSLCIPVIWLHSQLWSCNRNCHPGPDRVYRRCCVPDDS